MRTYLLFVGMLGSIFVISSYSYYLATKDDPDKSVGLIWNLGNAIDGFFFNYGVDLPDPTK